MKSPLFKYISVFAAIFFTASHNRGFASPETPAVAEPQTDTYIRHNPSIENPGAELAETADYPFLKLNANHIDMNGHSWQGLTHKLDNIRHHKTSDNFTIVHIGDSHIQADGNTGRIRKNLQKIYGDAGRGLMAPLRIAGTNQPLDYKFTTETPVTTATLLKMPWPVTMGFTGVAARPIGSSATFHISDQSPFNELRVYSNGPVTVTHVDAGKSTDIEYTQHEEEWGTCLKLDRHVQQLTVTLKGNGMIVYGFDARNTDVPGVLYHSIGNNGATYSTYSLIGNFGQGIAALSPDLVILSLGSNEAFGKISDRTFYNNICTLVKEIREYCPDAEILLTTPSECQRSVYTRTKKRRKRRRVVSTRTYQTNANIPRLREVIKRYGQENGVPVYDFYEVSGGAGSSFKWLQNRLLSTDRIHRTWNGYYLEGNLMYNALYEALTGKSIPENIRKEKPDAVKQHPEDKSVKVSAAKKSAKVKKNAVKRKKTPTRKKTRKKRRK